MALRIARPTITVLSSLLISLLLSCSDNGTGPSGEGTLLVVVSTLGSDLDSDGYSVILDGEEVATLPVDGSATLSSVSSGSHEVALGGLAANCTVSGDGIPRTVKIHRNTTVQVDFSVTCVQVTLNWLMDKPLRTVMNPSGRSPLSAHLEVVARMPVTVGVTVAGNEPISYVWGDSSSVQNVPIIGLYPGRKNPVELTFTPMDESFSLPVTIEVTAPTIPDFFPEIEILAAEKGRMEPGWNLASFSAGTGDAFQSYPFLFDTEGEIRWYLDLSSFSDMVYMVEPMRNGNLLFGQGSAIYEYDLMGNEVNRWEIPGFWFHHDVIEKPDGNFIVAVDVLGRSTVEDHVIEVDRQSGAVVREWDLRQVLDIDRRDFGGNDKDWFHQNATWYSAGDDALIISGRNQGVVKVSGDNELIWILAPHRGWGKAGVNGAGEETSQYLLTAVDDAGDPFPEEVQQGDMAGAGFSWSWGQHAPMIFPDGTLFLFDNGAFRNFSRGAPFYSRGVQYAVDEGNMTVRQVWQYGKSRGADFFSGAISDVDRLPETGNRLVMPGRTFRSPPGAYVTEVSYPDKDVLFDAHIVFKDLLSDGLPGWGGVDIVYRSERFVPRPVFSGSPKTDVAISGGEEVR